MTSIQEHEILRRRLELIAPELADLSPEMVLTPLLPSQVGYEVVDFQRFLELKQALVVKGESHKIKALPLSNAVEELEDHLTKLANSKPTPEENIELVIDYLQDKIKNVSRDEIRSVVTATSIAEDLTWLNNEFNARNITKESISEHSVWLHNLETGELVKWLDKDTHELLQMARLVGLIPFDTLRKLRDAKIVVAGASASAKTIDLLVSLGASNIHIWDNGKVSPVKLPLFPGWMGTIEAVGQYKSVALKKQCVGRSPFINFFAHVGLVLPDDVDKSSDDISFDDIIKGARFIIECVDSPEIKTQLRKWLAEHAPNLSTIFLADIGLNSPIGGIEKPGKGEHYHARLSEKQINAMSEKPTSLKQALSQVYHMVKKYLPNSHGIQFLHYLAGLNAGWSQSALASSESAVIVSTLMLAELQGEDVHNKNYRGGDIPNEFYRRLSKEQSKILRKIYAQIFKL